jgi:hypothetical protein
LKALVTQGADPKRDGVVRWRCVELQREIARRFAVEVHESTVGKWLHQFGLTRLQLRPFPEGSGMTSATSITVRVPLAIRHRPGRKTIVVPAEVGPAGVATRADPALVKALARAHRYQRMLD